MRDVRFKKDVRYKMDVSFPKCRTTGYHTEIYTRGEIINVGKMRGRFLLMKLHSSVSKAAERRGADVTSAALYTYLLCSIAVQSSSKESSEHILGVH